MELYIALALLAALLLWGIFLYNRFVSLGRKCQEGWSGILVQLKRRHDLIPNLVSTVKGYAAHEQSVLAEVTALRDMRQGASVAEVAASETMLSGALGRLFALAENYPDLKASANYLSLQDSLRETESEIQMARRYYNGTVRDYNILVASFPSLIIARMFSYREKEFFDLDDPAEAAAPRVSF